jgi:predicted dehydrogenase
MARTHFAIFNPSSMKTRSIGVILNGVTGRMGTNQHLVRSILAIGKQGGVRTGPDSVVIPAPVLCGRDSDKLHALAGAHGLTRWTTDLDAALSDPANEVFFDASTTPLRMGFVRKAIAAGKAVYCEKPTAATTTEALELARSAESAGIKNGVVQDKLWLPGLRKFQLLRDQGFFGRILSVRGEFGYWVFTGEHEAQPAQRPSWNYRAEDGGGIIIDMLCHWRYVIDNLFGAVARLSCLGATHIPQRWNELGRPYACSADDSAYATFETENGIICQFNSSWCVRVRRDDLLTMQVDGTHGSAVVTLRHCLIQPAAVTPRATWNPDIEQPVDFFSAWERMPDARDYDNAFKIQWELFLKHVATGAPFPWSLWEGAKGVQLAELGLQSWRERRWLEVPPLG